MLKSVIIPPPGFNNIPQLSTIDKTDKKTSTSGNNVYCNNCGKYGHTLHSCKMPITSIGIICFRINPTTNDPEYLMIQRRDTLGYIDFMRGKYSIYNKSYIMNMLKQMTNDEKTRLKTNNFAYLWNRLWDCNEWITNNTSKKNNQYNHEEYVSREKFNSLVNGVYSSNQSFYNLNLLIEESDNYYNWEEAEWGFPKGRRNYQEKDYDCATREFCEETGYSSQIIISLKNILPFEESFIGSNYKSYKHKYYIKYMDYNDSINMPFHQISEVSMMEWKSFKDAISSIRSYNIEKIRILENVNKLIIENKYI